MNTNDFALTILFGIKKFLAWIGIPSHMLDKMDELLFLIVIVIIAFIVAGIVHAVLWARSAPAAIIPAMSTTPWRWIRAGTWLPDRKSVV